MDRRSFLTAVAALPALPLMPRPAPAQTGFAGPLADLSLLPEAVFLKTRQGQFAEIAWGNPVAVANLGLGGGSFAPWNRFLSAFNGQYLATDWAGAAGFSWRDIARFTIYAAPPTSASILSLMPGKGAAVGPALQASGYAPTAFGQAEGYLKGELDNGADLTARNPADPFGGALGKSARVVVDGDHLIHASTTPMIEAMTGGMAAVRAGMASAPYGHAHLAPLDAALRDPGFGSAMPLQAVVLTDQMAFTRPGDGMGEGLSPWGLMMLADLSDGDTDHAAALVSYQTRAEAEVALERLSTRWSEMRNLRDEPYTQRAPLAGTVIAGDGPVAVGLRFEAPATKDDRPPIYSFLMQAAYMADLAPFGL